MADADAAGPRLLAVSDLHVGFAENREIVAGLRAPSPEDWLIVAGDVGEFAADIEWALGTLRERFAEVIWVPGNHELWTHRRETLALRGVERYEHLVAMCRRLGVHTPEDPYPVWQDAGAPLVIAPLFLLYDYTFLPDGAATKAEGLERAYAAGIVGNDETMLHADPYPSREAWCAARLTETAKRLGCPQGRNAHDPGESLPAGARADQGAALSGVRSVVRHGAHRRLAAAIQCGRRGLRPSAYPADDLARRDPPRRGVARLPARVAPPGQASRDPTSDLPRRRVDLGCESS